MLQTEEMMKRYKKLGCVCLALAILILSLLTKCITWSASNNLCPTSLQERVENVVLLIYSTAQVHPVRLYLLLVTKYSWNTYNAPRKQTSFNMHRNNASTKSVSNAKPDPSALPSTEGAARQNEFRVYHQIQFWLGAELPPVQWSWKLESDRL
ncbi:hypothetical protein JTB14_007284 [Gonioctena quinquepunctata]|nr:hypothetical protein JTB14_007284 [Gonioctena quinquepunctata]